MGFLDKFKKKKPAAVEKEKQEPAAVKPVASTPAKAKTGRKLASHILLRPILSEKGLLLASQGKYVFAVERAANKPEIKKTIENFYDVHVEQVKIINLPGKKRRYGRTTGMTSSWKKAVVKVKAGEKIPGIVESVG